MDECVAPMNRDQSAGKALTLTGGSCERDRMPMIATPAVVVAFTP